MTTTRPTAMDRIRDKRAAQRAATKAAEGLCQTCGRTAHPRTPCDRKEK
jgi:hypothetical protein